jgi:glycine cleavage system H protein
MKLAVLACNGVDKAEGALAREVGLQVAEATGAETICPVVLHCTPARYEKALGANKLIIVDGCGTRCASKLAAEMGVKPERKVRVSEVVKASGKPLGSSLRLGETELALAASIAAQLVAASSAIEAEVTPTIAWEAPTDFLVVVFDKFEFRIPRQEYWFSENDTWVRVEKGRARVGISDYLQQRLTDVLYFDPPQMGALVEQFGELGELESSKAVFEIIAPVSGTVVAFNAAVVEESPQSVNADPYGEGWLVEVELSAWDEEKELLMDGPAYSEAVSRKAAEY